MCRGGCGQPCVQGLEGWDADCWSRLTNEHRALVLRAHQTLRRAVKARPRNKADVVSARFAYIAARKAADDHLTRSHTC